MTKPLNLTGASACHSMIAGIATLKTIKNAPGVVPLHENDDGARRDYANADRLIGEAFDGFANDPGFRRALANFLLMVYAGEVPDMAKWAPSEMLTDDGFRGTDAEPAASAGVFQPDPARVRLALDALWEVESLADVIGERSDELAASDLWVRGIAARLADLASVGMSALNDGMPQALADARQTLNPWPRERE